MPSAVDTTAATTLRSCSTVMKSRPAAVIFILVTVTLDILAMGLIIPVLPKLILDFLGGQMTDAAKWTARFAVVFALMQFFFSPLLAFCRIDLEDARSSCSPISVSDWITS